MGMFGGSAQNEVDLGHVNERLDKLEAALAALQAQVAGLASAAAASVAPNPLAGTDPGDVPYGNNVVGGPWLDEVRSLKSNGKLIDAIKLYRENTGLGLKEAKDAVEGLV